MRALTKRQREVFDFVQGFIRERGYPPSLEQIGAALDMHAISTVWKHLTTLEAKGYISRRRGRSRSIEVMLGERRHCNTCTCSTAVHQ